MSLVYGRGKGYRNNIASLIIRHLDTGSKYRSIPGPTYKLQASKCSNLWEDGLFQVRQIVGMTHKWRECGNMSQFPPVLVLYFALSKFNDCPTVSEPGTGYWEDREGKTTDWPVNLAPIVRDQSQKQGCSVEQFIPWYKTGKNFD